MVSRYQWLLQSKGSRAVHVCNCCMMLRDAVDIVKTDSTKGALGGVVVWWRFAEKQ